jgi:hypothetical protein
MMTLLAVLFGITTFFATAVAIWQFTALRRLKQRFSGVLDLEREIAARRHAFNLELSRRQLAFDSELNTRRRMLEAELTAATRRPAAAAN